MEVRHQHLLRWLPAPMLWPTRTRFVDVDAAVQRMTAQWSHKLCSEAALTQLCAVQAQSFFNNQRATRKRGNAK